MAADPSIGMVFPTTHMLSDGGIARTGQKFGRQLGLDELPENFAFPVGTMFWARVEEALRPLFNLGLTWQDYPSEPAPRDGTVLHALERWVFIRGRDAINPPRIDKCEWRNEVT